MIFTSRRGRFSSRLVAVVGLVLSAVMTPSTMAFVTTSTTRRSLYSFQSILTALEAKKVKRKSSSSSSKTKSGGGFGKASAASTTSSSVIPFSGHSGSGTKALRKVANQFDAIRKEYDVATCCRDVYVRSPLHSPTTFWFVGKIASVPPSQSADDNAEPVDSPRWIQTALLLKRIIFEYSKDQLRPQVMGGKYAASLELWLAPGDSEMDTATNKVTLRPVKGSLSSSDTEISLAASDIGYNPEIYVGDERTKGGLRVERDENGVPTKAAYEVNFSE